MGTLYRPDLSPTEQELVVHLFAPTDGPWALDAYQQIRALWDDCRSRLGLASPIPETGVPNQLPRDLAKLPPGRLVAGARSPGADRQAVLRREHDMLNLSLAFKARRDAPSGWRELDRLWDEVGARATHRLVGQARLYLAKVPATGSGCVEASASLAADLEAHLPTSPQEPDWWSRGCTIAHGFAVWETSPREDERAERRIVVLGPPDRDPELSAWTWSRGDPAIPPLALYLMHAARVRYQLRVWAKGREVGRLRREVDACATELGRLLDGTSPATAWRRLARLEVAEAEVVLAQTALKDMRRAVEIAASNMTVVLRRSAPTALGLDPFGDDQALAAWFVQQLEDHAAFLENARERAERIGEIARGTLQRPPGPLTIGGGLAPLDGDRAMGRTEIRMGFAIDVVGYSRRPASAGEEVQLRLRALVREVVRRTGIDPDGADFQGTGDGMVVFLPPDTECQRALPALIQAMNEQLARDNGLHRDLIRLRMSTAVGPVGPAAIGFSGSTVIELARLIEGRALRRAVEDNAQAQLVVLVSDQLYTYFADGGHPGLDRAEFRRVRVRVKNFLASPWLWISPTPDVGGG